MARDRASQTRSGRVCPCAPLPYHVRGRHPCARTTQQIYVFEPSAGFIRAFVKVVKILSTCWVVLGCLTSMYAVPGASSPLRRAVRGHELATCSSATPLAAGHLLPAFATWHSLLPTQMPFSGYMLWRCLRMAYDCSVSSITRLTTSLG